MSFLSKGKTVSLKVEVNLSPGVDAEEYSRNVSTLLSNISAETLGLLAKASNNKLLMPVAIAQLRKHVS